MKKVNGQLEISESHLNMNVGDIDEVVSEFQLEKSKLRNISLFSNMDDHVDYVRIAALYRVDSGDCRVVVRADL